MDSSANASTVPQDRAGDLSEVRSGRPWYELWGTYAIAFLVVVAVALFLPSGPRQLGVSMDTYVLVYAALGLSAVASAILGGIALFRNR
jgi:hypothetical protein